MVEQENLKEKMEKNHREPPSPCPPNFLLRLSGKNALLLLLGHVKPQEKSWEPRASF